MALGKERGLGIEYEGLHGLNLPIMPKAESTGRHKTGGLRVSDLSAGYVCDFI